MDDVHDDHSEDDGAYEGHYWHYNAVVDDDEADDGWIRMYCYGSWR